MSYKDKLRWFGLVTVKKERYDHWENGSNNPFSANNILKAETSRWEPWFAWRPVLLQDDQWRWMKRIYRRRFFAQSSRTYKWAYGDEFDYLRDCSDSA